MTDNTKQPAAGNPATARATGDGTGNGKRKRLLLQLALAFGLVGAAYATYWALAGRFHETTDDAYVAGNQVSVMPQIAATVTAIAADETDLVRQGQPLITLDGTDTAIALEQAKAALAETVRQVQQLTEQRAQLRANVELRDADAARAKQDYTRREVLLAQHAVSTEELQHAETAYQAAQASLAAARHELAAASAMVGRTGIARHPQVLAAEARLREAYVAWERHVVLAPVGGYVARRSVQIGQRVSPGTPLMTIVPLDQLWIEANFKEGQFADIRLGQPVAMHADLYGGGVTFHGTVEGVSAGTGSAFALLPAQNASGNWIKIVQRVPVRIAVDARELAEKPLRIGLSMKVDVDTHARGGDILARAPHAGGRYQTDVYSAETSAADALIKSIVSANATGFGGVTAALPRDPPPAGK